MGSSLSRAPGEEYVTSPVVVMPPAEVEVEDVVVSHRQSTLNWSSETSKKAPSFVPVGSPVGMETPDKFRHGVSSEKKRCDTCARGD